MDDTLLARRVLSDNWPHLNCGNDLQAATSGFSGARVFRVACGRDDLCLRRWHTGMTSTRLAGIHGLLQHVRQQGVEQIPVPIPGANGRSVVRVNEHLWQLELWMPGRADFHDTPTDQRLESAMQVIARWHLAAASAPQDGCDAPHLRTGASPTVRERAELIRNYQQRLPAIETALLSESHDRFRSAAVRITAAFRRLSNRTAARLDAVCGLVIPLQPCIRDLWHDHLLFTDDLLTGLIDFGAVQTDTVACDLSRLLGSLCADNRVGWQTALNAYESVRPLEVDVAGLVRPLDESGVLLSGMTWLKRRYLLRSEIPQLDRTCERLERIADRLSTFDFD